MNNLIKYHHLGNLLIKVLNWFLFGKRSGKAFLPVSQKLGSSPLRQASKRQISSLRWALGGSFSKSLKTWSALPVRLSPCDLVMDGISWAGLFKIPENLICLAHQVFSLMALSWVGSRVLAPGRSQTKNNQFLDVIGYGSKVWCYKEQYCLGTWNVRFMN